MYGQCPGTYPGQKHQTDDLHDGMFVPFAVGDYPGLEFGITIPRDFSLYFSHPFEGK